MLCAVECHVTLLAIIVFTPFVSLAFFSSPSKVAAGLADFHDADAMRDENGRITSAAMVHADITTDQYVNIDGVFKLNDFNRCRFMLRRRDSAANLWPARGGSIGRPQRQGLGPGNYYGLS